MLAVQKKGCTAIAFNSGEDAIALACARAAEKTKLKYQGLM
jgi:hypothetical protein